MVFDSGVKGLERLLCHAKRPGMHCWQCSRFSPRGERNPFLRLSSVRRFRMAAERPLCPGLPGTQRAQPSTAQWRQSINLGGPSKASTSAYVGLGFLPTDLSRPPVIRNGSVLHGSKKAALLASGDKCSRDTLFAVAEQQEAGSVCGEARRQSFRVA